MAKSGRTLTKLTYLLKEASFWVHEFEEIISKEDYEKIIKAANKKYEKWIKDQFEIDQVSVDVNLRP